MGASEILHQLGVGYSVSAIRKYNDRFDPNKLQDAQANGPIEKGNEVEVLLLTSGKAEILVKNKQIGIDIISNVTAKAAKEAPGLQVFGAMSEEFDFGTKFLPDAIMDTYAKLEEIKSKRSLHSARFLRVPVAAECGTSGLPASVAGKNFLLSDVSAAKLAAANDHRGRMSRLLLDAGMKPCRNIDDLEKQMERERWMAIIHADGNGFGRIFMKFHELIGASAPEDNRRYVETIRRFSRRVDTCARSALVAALKETFLTKDTEDSEHKDRGVIIPIVPLIWDGDDVTVLCMGGGSLEFTASYLRHYEELTANVVGEFFGEGGRRLFSGGHLGMCAGVAIVKPHFPFHSAYRLAEQLVESAKSKVKQHPDGLGVSGLDFHVLRDSVMVDLAAKRKELVVSDGTACLRLYGGPYLIGYREEVLGMGRWDNLLTAVESLVAPDGGLASGMVHDLRASLFYGPKYAEEFWKAVLKRRGIDGSEFWHLFVEKRDECAATLFIDALDVAELKSY